MGGTHELARSALPRVTHQPSVSCPVGEACAAAGALEGEAGRLHRLLGEQPAADLHSHLGVLLTRQGQFAAGVAHLRRAAELGLDTVSVHNNLGIALARLGDLSEAVIEYEHALRLDPNATCARYNLGNTLRQLGRLDEAATHYEHALRLKPNDADTRLQFGSLHLDQNRCGEAVTHLSLANQLKPGSVEILNQLGVALTRLGQTDEAIARFQEALKARPDCPVSHNNIGIAFAKKRKFDAAGSHYQEVLRIHPGAAGTHANLGNALRDQGRLDEAIEHYQRSLELKPDAPDTHNNVGIAYVKQRRLELALVHYNEALQLKADFPEPHLNRAHAWLLEGNFQEGWAEYEWRWRIPGAEAFTGKQPLWDGGPLEGRTILLHWEQGLGDTLQFIRYAPLVKAKGGRVIVQCQAPLLRLLSRCQGIDQLLPVGAPLPDFDVHAPLQSLPRLLGTTLETIPAEVPYLFADPALVERWRQKLAPQPGFKVGIAWQGNAKYGGDLHRSIPLGHFLPLAGIPDVQFYSLQKGPGSAQMESAAARACVVDLASRLDSGPGAFVDTAAVMKNLDLVITSDTAIPHLAGGLGIPVWVALNAGSCWRWLLEREDSPWYPSMRLFRQTRLGDWNEVFERIAAELRKRVEAAPPAKPILIEVPAGELVDKITILEIKRARITDADKLANVNREADTLMVARNQRLAESPELNSLTMDLRQVNAALWDIEDEIRDCERVRSFGSRFIELARSVYQQNDRRAALKRQINKLLGSRLLEEKAYKPYSALTPAAAEAPAVPPYPAGRKRISLTMIVRNEESNLRECLTAAADLVDEVIIADTGSTDRTREIARRFGARVVESPWTDNFGTARNASLQAATGDWIWWLDADDRLDTANRDRARALFARLGNEKDAYAMKVRSRLNAVGTAARLLDQVRIFPNHPDIRWQYRVHEQIMPAVRRQGGDLRWADVTIEHTGYQDRALRRAKLERNFRLLQLDNAERPEDPYTLFNLGWTTLDLGHVDQAVGWLQRGLCRTRPTQSFMRKLYVLLTQAHIRREDPSEALRVCRQGRTQFPDDLELLFEEAGLLRAAGDLSAAESRLTELLNVRATSYLASMDAGLRGYKTRYLLGELCRAQGRTSEAATHWLAAVNERPDFGPAWQALGALWLAERCWPELERAARALEETGSEKMNATMLRARGHLARKEFTAARHLLEGELRDYPEALAPRVLLTRALLQEKQDWSAAEQQLREVLARDPDHAEARHNLAVLHRLQGALELSA